MPSPPPRMDGIVSLPSRLSGKSFDSLFLFLEVFLRRPPVSSGCFVVSFFVLPRVGTEAREMVGMDI